MIKKRTMLDLALTAASTASNAHFLSVGTPFILWRKGRLGGDISMLQAQPSKLL
jgi:hypothetical protein